MIVKVCGMREAANIRAVEALGISWMGFIFWPKSSRYVSELPGYLPERCKRVGVFVDADMAEILGKTDSFGLDVIQLHGKETPEMCRMLREGTGKTIVKALNIASEDDLLVAKDYEGAVDYLLFDTKAQMVGGNGKKFDWTVLEHYDGATPFLLSGGIGPDDAARVRGFHHKKMAGIDLNSRFETAPAMKDVEKLKSFLYEQNQ